MSVALTFQCIIDIPHFLKTIYGKNLIKIYVSQ